jgi:hypothetical protein
MENTRVERDLVVKDRLGGELRCSRQVKGMLECLRGKLEKLELG